MRCFVALGLSLLLSACSDFPKDANETLERTARGEPLKVGYAPAEPWVRDGGAQKTPAGIEPELIKEWARANGVRINWIKGGESQLVEALGENELDLVVGGFLDNNPHGAMIGTTQPYLTVKMVIGMAPGAAPVDEWKDVPVRYDARRPGFAAAIARAKAVPVPAAPAQMGHYAAVYEPELQALGLQPTGKTLVTERRVIATAAAENALTLSLDKFLHARKGAIGARLAAEARR